jgi:hypothetical protein
MIRTLVGQGQNPFAQARFASIVQLAVFEAVNAIKGDYEPYIGIVAPVPSSVDAAAATAAYRVLKTYFPAAPLIDDAYAASLAAIPAGPAKDNGISTGERAAAAMIANRVNDQSSPLTMSPLGLPLAGVWQLTLPPGCAATATGGAFYNWQDVTPFGIKRVEKYLLPPPPAITSRRFARDYNEVKKVGAVGSSSADRPADRADVVRFYAASSPALVFNLAARQVAEAQHRSTSDNARAFALINMASNDSLIASFFNKYYYDYWRPENAIRFTEDFGNRRVEPDPSFVPYISTPCFPSYPSNHGSGSNGAAGVLRRIYGEHGHSITMINPFNSAVANLKFTYTSFEEICDDISDARIFGGIHYRFDQESGTALGRAVAREVYRNNLQKRHHHKKWSDHDR